MNFYVTNGCMYKIIIYIFYTLISFSNLILFAVTIEHGLLPAGYINFARVVKIQQPYYSGQMGQKCRKFIESSYPNDKIILVRIGWPIFSRLSQLYFSVKHPVYF